VRRGNRFLGANRDGSHQDGEVSSKKKRSKEVRKACMETKAVRQCTPANKKKKKTSLPKKEKKEGPLMTPGDGNFHGQGEQTRNDEEEKGRNSFTSSKEHKEESRGRNLIPDKRGGIGTSSERETRDRSENRCMVCAFRLYGQDRGTPGMGNKTSIGLGFREISTQKRIVERVQRRDLLFQSKQTAWVQKGGKPSPTLEMR